VRLVKRVRVEGEPCWGSWEPESRLIRIEKGAPRQHQWKTLYHELVHAALHDAGLDELLTDAGHEAVCQALSSARVAERLTG
jgi:hypothetical protein